MVPGFLPFDNKCCIPPPALQQFRPVGKDAAKPLTWLCEVRLALPSFSLVVYQFESALEDSLPSSWGLPAVQEVCVVSPGIVACVWGQTLEGQGTERAVLLSGQVVLKAAWKGCKRRGGQGTKVFMLLSCKATTTSSFTDFTLCL